MSQVLGYTTDFAALRQHPGPARVRDWGPWDSYERRPSGLFVPGELGNGVPPGHPPIAVDLFAGAGGFSLGLHQAGYHVVAAVEKWTTAAATYLANLGSPTTRIVYVEDEDRVAWEKEMKPRKGDTYMRGGPGWGAGVMANGTGVFADPGMGYCHEALETGHITVREHDGTERQVPFHPCATIILGDARKVSGQDILGAINFATGWCLKPGEVDLVVGGPPCQGFSIAGRRNVYDDRNSLVMDFVRLVLEMQPKSMAMENVPEMLSMVTPDGELIVDKITRALSEGGFGAQEELRRMLEATSGVGAAQRGGGRTEKETRADRRRRLRDERKAAKKEAKQAGQDSLFGELA